MVVLVNWACRGVRPNAPTANTPIHAARFIPELAKGNCVYRILNQDFS